MATEYGTPIEVSEFTDPPADMSTTSLIRMAEMGMLTHRWGYALAERLGALAVDEGKDYAAAARYAGERELDSLQTHHYFKGYAEKLSPDDERQAGIVYWQLGEAKDALALQAQSASEGVGSNDGPGL